MTMQKYEIDKLRSLPCEGVAQRLGLTVIRHKALCPFHDDHTPSLTFKKNKFRCWSCGESGDSISLVEKKLGKNFVDACRWLADETGEALVQTTPPIRAPLLTQEGKRFDPGRYERYFERPWLNDEARKFLFEERRIDPRVVRWCRITSWKDRQGVPRRSRNEVRRHQPTTLGSMPRSWKRNRRASSESHGRLKNGS